MTYPTMGGHYMFDDDQEMPNTLTVIWELDDRGRKKSIVFDLRHWITHGEGRAAPEYHREPLLRLRRVSRARRAEGELSDAPREKSPRRYHHARSRPGRQRTGCIGSGAGSAAFRRAAAVISRICPAPCARGPGRLAADIQEGAISATLVRLANISYRLGRAIDFDPAMLGCADAEAQSMFSNSTLPLGASGNRLIAASRSWEAACAFRHTGRKAAT